MKPRRKTPKLKRRKEPTAAHRHHSSAADLQQQLDQRTRELAESQRQLAEALEQQTATTQILASLSSSANDAKLVFDAIVSNMLRLFHTQFTAVFLLRGEMLELAALKGDPEFEKRFISAFPQPVNYATLTGQVLRTGKLIHLTPLIGNVESTPETEQLAQAFNYNSMMIAPMIHNGRTVGAIATAHHDAILFTDKQIELVQNFASQAVIAIENTRLLNQLRQRTEDLSESLQQQIATADVLKVISRSRFELQPVFDTVLENAVRLCEAERSFIFLFDGKVLRAAASYNTSPELRAFIEQNPIAPGRHSAAARAALERRTVHIPDVQADPEYTWGVGQVEPLRTLLGVPMLKGDELVGVIVTQKREVKPFTDKQIALVEAFADQAIIAIENARLLNELRQRTDDLSESLEQQTATAEVLKTISRAAFDLQRVLETLLENAVRLSGANHGMIFRYDGECCHAAADYNNPPGLLELWQRTPIRAGRQTTTGRALLERRPVQITDAQADPEYEFPEALKLQSFRTVLAVPMLREGVPLGIITMWKTEVAPFTDRQIELVTTFADQAVIAIENARLLNELRESLEQQTATADVLKVISSSPGDLEPVFGTMLAKATGLCEASYGAMWLRDGDAFRVAALHGALPAAYMEQLRSGTVFHPGPDVTLSRVAQTGKAVQVADLRESRAYLDGDPLPVAAADVAGIRTLLSVPMFKDNELVGAIAIYRQEIRRFTDKQIELVQNFASQAVIAIQNARLLNELRQRTDDLSRSLEDLRTAQDRLVQTQKLASLGQLTAGIAHEIKNPLNFVNNFSGISVELIGELKEALERVAVDGKTRAEIDELANTLRDNLEKITQHGKRADAIVKNMLLHSREGSGEHRPVDINSIVEESLNLAYHGARAEKQGFTVTLERFFDPAAGKADVFPQDITRVLLNLISNGFYATTLRKGQSNTDSYEPTITAATRNLGERVEIRIRDNGTGVSPEVKEKMFNPFFTTKPTGEGTGLGLSISHDIVVKQHAGSIEVDTQPGEFTEIRIILPRVAAPLAGGRS